MPDHFFSPDVLSVDWPLPAGDTPRRPQAPDQLTYDLAHLALRSLTDAERAVVELRYGFRGEPRGLADVARALGRGRQRTVDLHASALARMRRALGVTLP